MIILLVTLALIFAAMLVSSAPVWLWWVFGVLAGATVAFKLWWRGAG